MAITKDDNIFIWGDPFALERITIHPEDNIVEIATGNYHGVALREDGTVINWGDWDFFRDLDQTNSPPQGYGYFKISCGSDHCVALQYTLD